MPYRSGGERRRPERVTEGAVADLVRQFADPYAFLRELVQNSIDAGATAITVRVLLGDDGVARTSVTDDGCGMTREIIEGPLLTMFSSAKEHDANKIGKYGIGFVSVFATAPHEVVVESWRAEGSWLLRLDPAFRYTLEHGRARPGRGTEVTLLHALAAEDYEQHARAIEAALRRWCRHVAVPLTLHTGGGDGVRIEQPLEVPCALAVQAEEDGTRYVLGPAAGAALVHPPLHGAPEHAASYTGFFNRGLLLREMDVPPHRALAGIRLKIDSKHLQHTLSRDDVRRDAGYELIVERAAALVKGMLRPALLEALSTTTDPARHAALALAALAPPFLLSSRELPLPLAQPIGGRAMLPCSELVRGGTLLHAREPGPVSEALAAEGIAVALLHEELRAPLAARFALTIAAVEERFELARPIAATAEGSALCQQVRAALERAGTSVPAVRIASVLGGHPRLGFGVDPADAERGSRLLPRGEWPSWYRRWRKSCEVWLVAEHPVARSALQLAAVAPQVAGALVARYLLVEEHGDIDDGDALLRAALGAAE